MVGCYFHLSRFFRCSLAHLHLVDGAPVLGVLGLGVGGVDDLLVVVEQLLADRTLGVQVLRWIGLENIFQFLDGLDWKIFFRIFSSVLLFPC